MSNSRSRLTCIVVVQWSLMSLHCYSANCLFFSLVGKTFSSSSATPEVRKALGDVKNQLIQSTLRPSVKPTPQKSNFVKQVQTIGNTACLCTMNTLNI